MASSKSLQSVNCEWNSYTFAEWLPFIRHFSSTFSFGGFYLWMYCLLLAVERAFSKYTLLITFWYVDQFWYQRQRSTSVSLYRFKSVKVERKTRATRVRIGCGRYFCCSTNVPFCQWLSRASMAAVTMLNYDNHIKGWRKSWFHIDQRHKIDTSKTRPFEFS